VKRGEVALPGNRSKDQSSYQELRGAGGEKKKAAGPLESGWFYTGEALFSQTLDWTDTWRLLSERLIGEGRKRGIQLSLELAPGIAKGMRNVRGEGEGEGEGSTASSDLHQATVNPEGCNGRKRSNVRNEKRAS